MSAEKTAAEAIFRRDDGVWTISFAGRRVRLADSKGLLYLARLLGRPWSPIHVLDVADSEQRPEGALPPASPDRTERARKSVRNRLRFAVARVGRLHPELGEHLERAVRTGTRCMYAPETAVRWQICGVEAAGTD